MNDSTAPQGVAEVMESVDAYAKEWHRRGSPLHNTTSQAARTRVKQAIAAIVQERDAAREWAINSCARLLESEARVAELERDAARWRKFAYEGIEVSASKNVPEHILVMARLDIAGMTFICEVGDYEKAVDAAIAAAKEPSHG